MTESRATASSPLVPSTDLGETAKAVALASRTVPDSRIAAAISDVN